jgi:hypothetical protein
MINQIYKKHVYRFKAHKPCRWKASSPPRVYIGYYPLCEFIIFCFRILWCSLYDVLPTSLHYFPLRKSRPETWPGKSVGRATPVRQLSTSPTLATKCNVLRHTNPVGEKLAHHREWFMPLYIGYYPLCEFIIFCFRILWCSLYDVLPTSLHM